MYKRKEFNVRRHSFISNKEESTSWHKDNSAYLILFNILVTRSFLKLFSRDVLICNATSSVFKHTKVKLQGEFNTMLTSDFLTLHQCHRKFFDILEIILISMKAIYFLFDLQFLLVFFRRLYMAFSVRLHVYSGLTAFKMLELHSGCLRICPPYVGFVLST